jgi:hypothetical protein
VNKIGTIRHPDIADALGIKDPGHPAAVCRGDQLAGKTKTHNLLKRKWDLRMSDRRRAQDQSDREYRFIATAKI